MALCRLSGGLCAKICRVPGPPTRASCRARPMGTGAHPAQERSHARDGVGGTPETGFWRPILRMPQSPRRKISSKQTEALLPMGLTVRVSRAAAVARGERAFCPVPPARAMHDDLGYRAVADFLV